MEIVVSGDIVFQELVSRIELGSRIKRELTNSDFQLANLEAPLKGVRNWVKAGPRISQRRGLELILPYYSHMSLANNHIMDYGKNGLINTTKYLDSFNMEYSGAGLVFTDIYKPLILSKENISVAVLCLGESEFGSVKDLHDKYESGGYAYAQNN